MENGQIVVGDCSSLCLSVTKREVLVWVCGAGKTEIDRTCLPEAEARYVKRMRRVPERAAVSSLVKAAHAANTSTAIHASGRSAARKRTGEVVKPRPLLVSVYV